MRSSQQVASVKSTLTKVLIQSSINPYVGTDIWIDPPLSRPVMVLLTTGNNRTLRSDQTKHFLPADHNPHKQLTEGSN